MKPKVDYLSLTADQLKEKLANDHLAQFAALAALGGAAEAPDADLEELRAKQAAVRALLAPPAAAGAAFSSYDGRSVMYASPPAAAMAPRWWKKEIARAGSYIHPVTRKPVDLSMAVLAHIAEQSSRYLDAVGKVPFVASDAANSEHRVNQDSTKGWAHAFSLEGDRLFALLEVTNTELAARIGTDVQFVSMAVKGEARDELGNVYRGVIDHVAATPIPVLSVQTNFEQVALARAGGAVVEKSKKFEAGVGTTGVGKAAAKKRKSKGLSVAEVARAIGISPSTLASIESGEIKMPSNEVAAKLKKALNTLKAKTSGQSLSRAEVLDGELQFALIGEDESDLRELAILLSRENHALKAQVDAFSKREQEADATALEGLLAAAKETALSRGNPGAIDDDVAGAVTELWKLGKKAEAKTLAERLAGTSLQASKGKAGTKEVRPPVGAEQAKVETDELETYAKSASLQGFSVAWAGDRKSVTVRKGDLEFTRSRA